MARYNLGVGLQQLKQYPEALVQYQQAILLNPNMPDAFFNLGVTLEQAQRRDEAMSFLLQAKSLYSFQGNLPKVDEIDQYMQKLAAQPTIPGLTQPVQGPTMVPPRPLTQPPTMAPQQPNSPRLTPLTPPPRVAPQQPNLPRLVPFNQERLNR
jgi:tetratricopeptide (TPR) repeat protein